MRMQGLKYVVIVVFFTASLAKAQYTDTLRKAFMGPRKLDIGFDSRNSFVDNKRVGVYSIKLGVVFGKKIAMGMGYAWLNSRTPVFETYKFYDKELKKDTSVDKRLTFNYVRGYINYIYYKSRRWEFSIPIQFGIGKLGFKYKYDGVEVKNDEGYCLLYEPEVDVKCKVFRWLGVEGDVGYRFLFKGNKVIKNTFNSPLVSVGVFVVWSELALVVFPKNQWVQKKYGPGDW